MQISNPPQKSTQFPYLNPSHFLHGGGSPWQKKSPSKNSIGCSWTTGTRRQGRVQRVMELPLAAFPGEHWLFEAAAKSETWAFSGRKLCSVGTTEEPTRTLGGLQENSDRKTDWLPKESMGARRQWNNLFNTLKEAACQPGLCPDKILFKMRVKDIFRQTKLASFVTGHTCTKGNSIKETNER